MEWVSWTKVVVSGELKQRGKSPEIGVTITKLTYTKPEVSWAPASKVSKRNWRVRTILKSFGYAFIWSAYSDLYTVYQIVLCSFKRSKAIEKSLK